MTDEEKGPQPLAAKDRCSDWVRSPIFYPDARAHIATLCVCERCCWLRPGLQSVGGEPWPRSVSQLYRVCETAICQLNLLVLSLLPHRTDGHLPHLSLAFRKPTYVQNSYYSRCISTGVVCISGHSLLFDPNLNPRRLHIFVMIHLVHFFLGYSYRVGIFASRLVLTFTVESESVREVLSSANF